MVNWEYQESNSRYVRDPRLGHRFSVNFKANTKNNELETDNYGFIHNGISNRKSLAKKKNKRIVLLGGSLAMGMGATNNSKTIAARLEFYLRKDKKIKNIEVINAGCGAYCSWQEVIKLSLEIIALKPDLVIDISGWNDMCHFSWGNKKNGDWIENHDRSIEDIANLMLASQGKLTLFDLIKIKVTNMNIYNFINLKISNFFEKKYSKQEIEWGHHKNKLKFRKNGVENYLRNINTMNGICKGHKIKFIHIIQPNPIWISLKNKFYINNNHQVSKDIKKHLTKNSSLISISRKFINEVRLLYSKNKSKYDGKLDLADSKKYLISDWIDHCHLSNSGQDKLAKDILKLYYKVC